MAAVAVALLAVPLASPAWADFQDGQRAYQRGDYAAAYREWLPLAEHGDAASQASLGTLYVNGQGVAKDDAEAVKWLRLAAEQGNAIAQNNLGFMYGNGRGVPRDDAQAVEWYRRSADQGNAFGQAVLGRMYTEGRGVPKDPVLAYMWYSLAIKQQPVLEWALKGRERVSAELSPEQIATGERMAHDWKPKVLRLWAHIYSTPGANPNPIAKPWIKGPLYGAEMCLGAALKQANLLTPPPPRTDDGLEFAGYRQRALQDGVVWVGYLRPSGSAGGGSPVIVARQVCKPDEWQPPTAPDARADGREALQDAVFSFGPPGSSAPAGNGHGALSTIFVESALLDKHPMNQPEGEWCLADVDCHSRLNLALSLLKKATATTGAITYTPGRPIIVSVTLNGRTTARLILDTGADRSMVKPAALAAAGVDLSQPAGRIKMEGVAGATMMSYFPVEFEVAGHRALVSGVTAFDTIKSGFADGLLGRDFLDHFKVAIDPAAGTVTLTPK